MTTASAADLRQKMLGLREEYARKLPERVAQLEQFWDDRLLPAWDDGVAKDMRLAAHSLKGSALTYGFAEVGAAARKIQSILNEILDYEEPVTTDRKAEMRRTLDELRAAIAAPPPPAQDPGLDARMLARAPRGDADGPRNRVFYLLEGDAAVAADLATRLEARDLIVERFTTFQALNVAVMKNRPHAIMVDWSLRQSDPQGAASLERINQMKEPVVPIVVTAAETDIDQRLAAVRSGAVGFLTKPVGSRDLAAALSMLQGSPAQDPYRVLIVDDDEAAAKFHSFVLREAGMTTKIVMEPLTVLDQIAGFQPDLVLMDMYMPECTGEELAAVIRQFSIYASVPVVYLSAEHNLDKQVKALGHGGDGFLVKPVRPARLLSAVTTRIERTRLLRNLTTLDPLTALPNHNALMERLEEECVRAADGRPLEFALVGIDGLEELARARGQQFIDALVAALGRALRDGLERRFPVGRHSAAQFAVILPEQTAGGALVAAEDMRRRFLESPRFGVLAQAGRGNAPPTVSIGLAGYAGGGVEALVPAAEKALEEAQRRGGNRTARA